MTKFVSRSKTFHGEVAVDQAVDEAFAHFSPQGERSWVPGWDPEPIHPAGVPWTEGQIFRTKEGDEDAVWVVARLDRAAHEVTYYRVEPSRWVARIDVRCAAAGDRRTRASVTYAFIGLTDAGNAALDEMTDERYAAKLERWADWIARAAAGRPPARTP